MIGEQILQNKSTVTLSTEKHMDGSKKPAGNFSFVKNVSLKEAWWKQ